MKLTKIILIFLFSASPLIADTLDRIVAVVDKQIILKSELDAQTQLYAMQNKLDLSNTAVRDTLQKRLLDKMVEDKVILVEAQLDTSVSASNKEVDDALTQQIAKIKTQFPSDEAFQNQLRTEGLTLKELREQYRDELKNQLLKEKFIQKKLEKVKVSSGEVKEFYQANADSIPNKPAGVRLAHILISTQPGKATHDSLMQYAQMIRKKAVEGEDFALLAKTYSQDPSASAGGDLGWFSRGEMVAEIENAAFTLQPGQISDVVETNLGLTIIKCTGRKGDKINANEISITLAASDKDRAAKLTLADSLYQAIQNGADFGELARKFSSDDNSRDSSGELGWYGADDLLPVFKEAISQIEVGQVSKPVESEFGYHLVKLEDRKDAGKVDLKNDYDTLAEMARRAKVQVEIEGLISKVSAGLYIDKRL
jgi:peptidyl-prolyl cis-trans isomerase SurA